MDNLFSHPYLTPLIIGVVATIIGIIIITLAVSDVLSRILPKNQAEIASESPLQTIAKSDKMVYNEYIQKEPNCHVRQEKKAAAETSRPPPHSPHARPHSRHAAERRARPHVHAASERIRVAIPQRRSSHQHLQSQNRVTTGVTPPTPSRTQAMEPANRWPLLRNLELDPAPPYSQTRHQNSNRSNHNKPGLRRSPTIRIYNGTQR